MIKNTVNTVNTVNMVNMVILALRSYQTNVQLAKSVKKMLNKALTLGQR